MDKHAFFGQNAENPPIFVHPSQGYLGMTAAIPQGPLSPRLLRTKRNEPQWADYYWIDMVKLCPGFLGEGQEVEKVIYFTASPLNLSTLRRALEINK